YLALRRHPRAALLVLVDLALLARLDTGVTVAIDGAGLLLALAAAAHDTLYTDADRRILDAFARQARPIVVGQAVVLLALASLVALWAVAGGDDALLPQSMTRAAVHTLLPAAVLFAVTAALLWQRASTR